MEYLRGLVAAVKPRRPGAGAAEEQHERPTKRCRCQASSTSAVSKSQWGQGLVSRYGGEPGSQGRKLRLQYTRQFLDFAVVRAGAQGGHDPINWGSCPGRRLHCLAIASRPIRPTTGAGPMKQLWMLLLMRP
jgi:hypothetical protein